MEVTADKCVHYVTLGPSPVWLHHASTCENASFHNKHNSLFQAVWGQKGKRWREGEGDLKIEGERRKGLIKQPPHRGRFP